VLPLYRISSDARDFHKRVPHRNGA